MTVVPGGTTTVVLCAGGGGLLLLNDTHPHNADGSSSTIRAKRMGASFDRASCDRAPGTKLRHRGRPRQSCAVTRTTGRIPYLGDRPRDRSSPITAPAGRPYPFEPQGRYAGLRPVEDPSAVCAAAVARHVRQLLLIPEVAR